MENTTAQHRSSDDSSTGSSEQTPVEAAARAVARMLANPRRIRRD